MFQLKNDAIQPARIKVIGVGGAGGNAVNRMISYGFAGVDFIAVNTDLQMLSLSKAPQRVQIGKGISRGLGGGGNPEVGRKSAEENKDEIKELIEGTDLLFITAGMGGATGTGASPIIAEIAKEMNILTVAVVTKPFMFEGKKRMNQAGEGIQHLKEIVDTMLVIPNEKLKNISDDSTPLNSVFESADNVLYQAVKGISDIIITPGLINRDFADVKTVMSYRGDAVIGVGAAKGEERGASAAQIALECPILEDSSIEGASAILVTVAGPSNLSMKDMDSAMEIIRSRTGEDIEILLGAVLDENLQNELRITIVATGIRKNMEKRAENAERIELFMDKEKQKEQSASQTKQDEQFSTYNNVGIKRIQASEDDLEQPAFLRRAID